MKIILLCFLSDRSTDEVRKISGGHFPGFKFIDGSELNDLQNNAENIRHHLIVHCTAGKLEKISDLINSAQFKNLNSVLLVDTSISSPDANLMRNYDLVMHAKNGFNQVSEIVGALSGSVQAAMQLAESEQKYNTLVNNLPGITYRCKNDSDWTMIYLSRKVEKLTGYSSRAFVKTKEITYSDIIVPQDREKVWLTIQKALKKNLTFQIEYRIKTASGRIKWVWEQGRAVQSQDENQILEGIIMDIDEEKNLKKRMSLMRDIVLAMNDSSDLNDLIEIIRQQLADMIMAGEFYLQLFDWEKREFLVPFVDEGREFFRHIPMTKSLDALVIKRNRSVLLQKNEIMKLERQGKLKLEHDIPEVWLGVPLQMNGKASGIIVLQDFKNEFAINKTDVELLEFVSVQIVVSIMKKQAEDESRKLLKALEQSPIAVIITDLEGHTVYANHKAADITGFDIDEMMGKIPNIIEPYDSDADHYKNIWDALLNDGSWEGEYQNKNKAGELYWEYAIVSSIKNSRGKTTHYLYLKEEISERKRIDKELRKAKTLAEESDKLKTAFLANMSHEIRTPMNAIIGFTEMLRTDDYSAEEHEEFFSLIIENSKKLLNTIDNIIDIAKIEAGQLVISNSRCSANKILYDNYYAFEKKKVKLDKSMIRFEARQYKENENIFFQSDPIRINQVLRNLIENAFKYTYEGTVEFGYTLTSYDGREYIDFYVKDSGEGISSGKMESIFNRFTQASDNYMSTTGGTGLGLAISRNIARLMNGDIRLESSVGRGSVFHFLIPYSPIEDKYSPDESEKKATNKELNWPDKIVLIAEDEDSNYKLLEVMLRKTRVKIERAYNGKQALDYVLGGNDVDLILMDVRMPVMNGYEATEHIKKFSPSLPVVIQTAFALSGDRENSFEAGCDEYLSKPIKATELYEVMKKFLD